jgi:hypothetical protein
LHLCHGAHEGKERADAALKVGCKPADIRLAIIRMVNTIKAPSQTRRSLHPAIPLLWLGLAVWGTLAMMSASSKPGSSGAPPAKWPMASSLPRPSQRPTLIMFLDYDCDCSKASVGELSSLMSSCQGQVNTHVLFFKPARGSTDSSQSDLYRSVTAIPGVKAAPDVNGREARLFGAETSGEVVLYGADGRLRFRGGMTVSRGCLGDNPGLTALQALIGHQGSQVTQTPVFGCPLLGHNLAAKR